MTGLVNGDAVLLFQDEDAFVRVAFSQAIGSGKSYDATTNDADVAFHLTQQGSIDFDLPVGAVEVEVPTIGMKDLSRGVGGAIGREEDDGIGDFFGGRHAVAQRDVGVD